MWRETYQQVNNANLILRLYTSIFNNIALVKVV